MLIVRSLRLVTHPKGPGKGYWVWVRFYETVEDLRKAAYSYDTYKVPNEFNRAEACFNPSRLRFVVDKKGKMVEHLPPNKCLGVIRIVRGCSYEIVAHEVVHASLHIYRRVVRPNANFWRECHEAEEDFAYIYGQLFEEFMYQV